MTKNYYFRTLTSSHLSESALKRQQKSQDNYLMAKHDQEMHMTGNAQKEHEEGENQSINKHPKLPETIWIDQPQEALTKSSQSKLMK